MIISRGVLLAALLAISPVAAASLEQAAESTVIDGPQVPVAPEVVTRDAEGHITVRAIRLTEPLRVDGELDEAVYQSELPISDFVQLEPVAGTPATERTEAWVMFDAENIYVSARCWDSAPPDQWTANEMRRDSGQLLQNDTFGMYFDTYYDRRNAFVFYANPLGGFSDRIVTDEGPAYGEWNAVWDVQTGRFDGGWTIEMVIPFKTLRYKTANPQTWGVQLRRVIRRKNEWTYLTTIPASVRGSAGITRISYGATLVGLEVPSAGRNVEIKPYAISRLTTDGSRTPTAINDLDGHIGLDVKYGVTPNITADLTYNTDFAQVEVDEQQVNLTRFSLFFPEKRDFFLEGRSTFDFASGAGGSRTFGRDPNVPSLFYSRRIGLSSGRVVPIDAGGRLTGTVGNVRLGLLNLQTGGESVAGAPSTNFTALRVKRDILRRSWIGAMFTNRSQSSIADGSNQALGVDAAFAFFENVTMSGYYAQTRTPGHTRDDTSYQGKVGYIGDRYGARLDYLHVGEHFNPEVGFVQRNNLNRTTALVRFSPRPKRNKWVRKVTSAALVHYIESGAGLLETREQIGRFNIEFESSDQFMLVGTRHHERLVQPFAVSRNVSIPSGGYTFSDLQASYRLGRQRRVSGTVLLQHGNFYNGTLTTVGYTTARVSVIPQFSLEPSFSYNVIDLPTGAFTKRVIRTRAEFAFSPRMFASALVQYASADNTFSSNLRFRWEYRPGSEFFAVYTDERDTLVRGVSHLRNRAFVLKITRLLQF